MNQAIPDCVCGCDIAEHSEQYGCGECGVCLNGPSEARDAIIRHLLRENDALREQLNDVRGYSVFSAQGCTLCTYEAGVFVKACGYHEEVQSARAALSEAETRIAFLTDNEIPDPKTYGGRLDARIAAMQEAVRDSRDALLKIAKATDSEALIDISARLAKAHDGLYKVNKELRASVPSGESQPNE